MKTARPFCSLLDWVLVLCVNGLILCAIVISSGCALGPRAVTPTARSTAGAAQIHQTGDAAQPATATSDTTAATVPLPAGSVVSFAADGSMSAKLSGESIFRAEARRDAVTGPQAFTPPAPPTPSALAAGRRTILYTYAALACIVVAGLCAWRAHWLAAILAGIAAAACHLLSSPAGLYAAGVLVAGAACFVAAWHITRRQSPAFVA